MSCGRPLAPSPCAASPAGMLYGSVGFLCDARFGPLVVLLLPCSSLQRAMGVLKTRKETAGVWPFCCH